jgi:hypothetical protein
MICPFCRKEFSGSYTQKACQTCSFLGGCKNTKCPYCGYEFPQEPILVKKFHNIIRKIWRTSNEKNGTN